MKIEWHDEEFYKCLSFNTVKRKQKMLTLTLPPLTFIKTMYRKRNLPLSYCMEKNALISCICKFWLQISRESPRFV